MTNTLVADPEAPPPGRAPMSTGDRVRFVLRGIGQTLITLGLVVLLFVVYEVWITNISADRNNSKNISDFRKEIDTVAALPGSGTSSIPIGSALGILYIPRLGSDYHEAIVQGSTVPDDSQLEQGTAHYGDTQLPGQKGNFAVAGHRVGKGEPFLNIDQLRSGDAVIVETKTFWYVYRVLGSPSGGDPQTDAASTVTAVNPVQSYSLHGRQIIDPSDGGVLAPIPNNPGVPASRANQALMTMTTCHPKFTASHRMIIFSKLQTAIPADPNSSTSKASDMPAQISALFGQVSG